MNAKQWYQRSTWESNLKTHFISHLNSSHPLSMAESGKRVAVVTGGNKGIGFEICRQLACNGVMVVLTARDEKRGSDAVEKLKDLGFSDLVVFHCLDVGNSDSVDSLADFVKHQFGKLDILVNNAGISGTITDVEALEAAIRATELEKEGSKINWAELMTETHELAESCLQTNYYGAKRMVEAFIPLLQLSDSPKIVNVSSSMGKLKNITNEWAKGQLEDAENLTEEKIDEVLNELLKDFKENNVKSKGWPTMSPYILSKAAMNAYTRILAKKYQSFCINCVCPGYVKTDLNYKTGFLTVEEGADTPVWLALLPNDSPSGLFYFRKEVTPF